MHIWTCALIVNSTLFTHGNKYTLKCMSLLSSYTARYATQGTISDMDLIQGSGSHYESEAKYRGNYLTRANGLICTPNTR